MADDLVSLWLRVHPSCRLVCSGRTEGRVHARDWRLRVLMTLRTLLVCDAGATRP